MRRRAVGWGLLVAAGAGVLVCVAAGCCCGGFVAVAAGTGVCVLVAFGAGLLVAVGVGVSVSMGVCDNPLTWNAWVAVYEYPPAAKRVTVNVYVPDGQLASITPGSVTWPSLPAIELGSVLVSAAKSGPFAVVGVIIVCIGDVGPVAILVRVVYPFEDHVEGSLLALIEGGRQTVDLHRGRGHWRGRRGWG